MSWPRCRGHLISMPDEIKQKEALIRVITLAQQWSGCNFLRYNPGTLERRVGRRMIDARCQNISEYLDFLERHPSEYHRLVAGLTIKVSCFFRDPPMFSILEKVVLPRLFAQAKDSGRRQIRVWSTACAGGEEAYSLAILFAEQTKLISQVSTSILATDLDADALASAATGLYPDDSLREIAKMQRDRFFVSSPATDGEFWQIRPALRAMVDFVVFDLTSTTRTSPPSGIFAEYDLILCRNMLIYCQPSLKLEIIRRLHTCLRPGGYLVLGRSESLPEEYKNHFVHIDQRVKIYAKEE